MDAKLRQNERLEPSFLQVLCQWPQFPPIPFSVRLACSGHFNSESHTALRACVRACIFSVDGLSENFCSGSISSTVQDSIAGQHFAHQHIFSSFFFSSVQKNPNEEGCFNGSHVFQCLVVMSDWWSTLLPPPQRDRECWLKPLDTRPPGGQRGDEWWLWRLGLVFDLTCSESSTVYWKSAKCSWSFRKTSTPHPRRPVLSHLGPALHSLVLSDTQQLQEQLVLSHLASTDIVLLNKSDASMTTII